MPSSMKAVGRIWPFSKSIGLHLRVELGFQPDAWVDLISLLLKEGVELRSIESDRRYHKFGIPEPVVHIEVRVRSASAAEDLLSAIKSADFWAFIEEGLR